MKQTKTIVVVGSSRQSWEDAARQIVRKVSETVPSLRGIDVVHQSAHVEGGDIVEYRVTAHVHFDVDADTAEGTQAGSPESV